MKKIFSCLFISAMFLSICSCNSTHYNVTSDEFSASTTDKIYLNEILEADTGIYDQEPNLNHKNIIDTQPESSVDRSKAEKTTVKIDGKDRSLDYSDTLFYPVGEKKVDCYYVDGNKDSLVLLNSDGSINSILYQFSQLNISKTESPDQVKLLLDQKLRDLVDISRYEYVQIPSSNESLGEGFGLYDYLYYNMMDGYMTDYIRVSVLDDGSVLGFSINEVETTATELNIDEKKEDELLVLKLKDIYTTAHTEYVSHKTVFPPQLVTYQGELYVQHYVSVVYRDEARGELSSFINTILLPVQAINRSNAMRE